MGQTISIGSGGCNRAESRRGILRRLAPCGVWLTGRDHGVSVNRTRLVLVAKDHRQPCTSASFNQSLVLESRDTIEDRVASQGILEPKRVPNLLGACSAFTIGGLCVGIEN